MTVSITRSEHTAAELRREAGRTADARASRRMLALALVLDGKNRETAARQCGMDRQTLRDWVHRYNADGLPGLSDQPHGGGARSKLTEGQGCEPDRSWRQMAWFAGAWLTCASGSRASSASSFTSAASASCCGGCISVACRCARATPRPTRPPRRRIKKPCRSGRSQHPARSPRQADRALAARRSPCRPARQPDLHLGRAGQPPDRATRPSLRLGVHLRRRLPGARHRRRAAAAVCRRGCDEPAPGHDQRARRARGAWGPGTRRRGLASTRRTAPVAGQDQLVAFAIILARTEPRRECLAVPQTELSQQSRFRHL